MRCYNKQECNVKEKNSIKKFVTGTVFGMNYIVVVYSYLGILDNLYSRFNALLFILSEKSWKVNPNHIVLNFI